MDALLAGACGYLVKDASIDQIVEGITAAARGESLISPRIASQLVRRLREPPEIEPGLAGAELTPRELEVLELLARGMDNPEIATGAVPEPAHGEESRVEHPGEAAGRESDPSRGACCPQRSRLDESCPPTDRCRRVLGVCPECRDRGTQRVEFFGDLYRFAQPLSFGVQNEHIGIEVPKCAMQPRIQSGSWAY